MQRLLRAILIWLFVWPSASASAMMHGIVRNAFGVNLSGPEFAPWNGQAFPSVAIWDDLRSFGITIVRLPLAWESLQPTLGGSLDTTYVNNIKTALSRAAARGIIVILDLHNFGALCDQSHWVSSGCGYAGNAGVPGTGVTFLGAAGGPTAGNFTDVWTKLATAVTGLAGLGGYNIMNEPNDTQLGATNLLFSPNGFGNTVSVQPWAPGNSSVVTQLAAGTNPLGSTYGPAWSFTSAAGFGGINQSLTLAATPYTLSCYAKVASGSATLLYLVNPGSLFTTAAVNTSWQRSSFTFTPTAGGNVVTIAEGAGTAGVTIQLANCQLELGGSATTYVPSPLLAYYQPAITAIRAVDGNAIYIDGLSGSTPYQWPWTNWELAQLTGSNLVFNAHAYFCTTAAQGGGGSDCSGTFSSYTGLTVDSGVDFATPFVNWTTTVGVQGAFGEFGTTKACCVASPLDSNASWLTLSANFLAYAFNNHMLALGWSYTELDPTQIFNLTNGDTRMPTFSAQGKNR